MNRPTSNQNTKTMPKPDNRPPCHIPNSEVTKQWMDWRQMGMGPCDIEHRETKNHGHVSRVCSPIWCSVTNDSGTRICPPQWWERSVQESNKS